LKRHIFLLYFTLFALLIGAGAWGVQQIVSTQIILGPHFWVLFGSLYVLTIVAYLISDIGIKSSAEYGVYAVLGGIVLKMLFCLMLIVVLILKYPETKLVTAFNFFSLYLLFTIFEVICLLRNLRDQKKL
jgi:hypothetical protein